MLIIYNGDGQSHPHKDLTIGREYEARLLITKDWYKIERDDAGDRHDVRAEHCIALDDRPIQDLVQGQNLTAHEVDPSWGDFVAEDWAADEANDAHAANPDFDDAIQFSADIGIEAIRREVAPEPEGPKSTEDLRAHRYTPDLY